MSLFSAIRDLLGIRKDLVETKKAKLETEKLEHEGRARESMIEKPDAEDVKKYDPKTKKLIKKVAPLGAIIALIAITLGGVSREIGIDSGLSSTWRGILYLAVVLAVALTSWIIMSNLFRR